MQCPKALCLLPFVFIGLVALGPAWPRAPTDVDLALVLAVDVSTSMDPDEQDLQRQGYVEAFRSPAVHQAVRTGMLGRIAVTYVEWAGATRPRYQNVVVPWTILENPHDSISFADRLARAPIHPVAGTSISGAIDFSLALLSSGHFLALRQVIDISGDGANNQGRPVTDARDEAVARGVTINGLPIMLKEPERRENATMDAYYRDCVVGGSGAFLVPVREREQFLTQTRTKIVREIASIGATGSSVQPIHGVPLTDCDADNSFWDDFAPVPHAPVIGFGRAL
jgi:hypothetical protein